MQMMNSWMCIIAFSVERSSRSVSKRVGCVCRLTSKQKIGELQAPKEKKVEHFQSLLFRQQFECPDVFGCYHQQLFVHTGVSQWKMVLGEDKLWFKPNDEKIQESMCGAQEPRVGEESVCATPPLLGSIYSP